MTEEKLLEKERNAQTSVKLSSPEPAQSSDYANTMETLKRQESSLPEYTGSYDAEIRELYGRIVNRGGFKYSTGSDPLYGVYRDRYTREGGLAMRDSMGQAAALTGGYGSSYAQTVGRQQYDAYLQKLSDAVPELYSAAYQQYKDEGDSLSQQLAAAQGLAEAEYGRHRDSVADDQFAQELEAETAQQSFSRQQSSFNSLMQLISATGYQPSSEELQKAGMSQAQAEALRNTYLRVNGLLPVTVGTQTVSYYDSGSYGGDTQQTQAKTKAQMKLDANAKGATDTHKSRRKI